MTTSEGIVGSDITSIWSLCFIAKYYGISINEIVKYTYSRLGMMHSMIKYIEDPSKLDDIGKKNHSFMAGSLDEVRTNILQKFSFLG